MMIHRRGLARAGLRWGPALDYPGTGQQTSLADLGLGTRLGILSSCSTVPIEPDG